MDAFGGPRGLAASTWRARREATTASEDFLSISALGIAGLLWTALYCPRMAIRFEKIWVQQCRATKGIKRRFGAKSALDYLIRERTATFPRGSVADLQRIRNCGLRFEPEAQAAENPAHPAVPAVSLHQFWQLLPWDQQTD